LHSGEQKKGGREKRALEDDAAGGGATNGDIEENTRVGPEKHTHTKGLVRTERFVA